LFPGEAVVASRQQRGQARGEGAGTEAGFRPVREEPTGKGGVGAQAPAVGGGEECSVRATPGGGRTCG